MQHKRGGNCKKEVVKKDILENLIIDTTFQILNNPETVNFVAEQIISAHQNRLKDQSFMTILLKEQSEFRKSLNNIMSAIEKGIVTNSTKQRLEELEAVQSELLEKIAIEKTKLTILLTKEEIVGYIKTALKKEPKQMIDLLIRQIKLHDDKIEIFYKHTNNKSPDECHQDFRFHEGSTRSLLAEWEGFEPSHQLPGLHP